MFMDVTVLKNAEAMPFYSNIESRQFFPLFIYLCIHSFIYSSGPMTPVFLAMQ